MATLALLMAVLIFTVFAAAVHQWVVSSQLLELGEASWFPRGGDISAVAATTRSWLAIIVSLAAWFIATVLILLAPFRLWVWGVVVLLALTVAISPVFAVYHYTTRVPMAVEAESLDQIPEFGCEVLVVTTSRGGPINGYAIGGPFRDVVGVSEFALSELLPDQIAALVAHEATHHHERHVLIRGGASLAVLGVSAAILTTLFETLVPLSMLGLVVAILLERIVSYWVMRRLEYRADTIAARRTSVEAVRTLLATLEATTTVDQTQVSQLLRLFSTHPPYADRLERLAASTDSLIQ
jgi:Zn-dependent protease with chaperone function